MIQRHKLIPWAWLAVPALVLVGGIAVGYIWHSTWLAWLQAPLHSTLYYSDAADVSAYLLPLCLLAGLLFLLPFLVHRLVLQARPGAPNRAMVVMASYALVSTGVLSAYFVSLPAALHLLRAIDVQHLHPLIAANSYMSFVINYLAISAIAFQLPLLILCADYLTPIPPESLRKQQHVVIIGAFAVALILPVAPDPVSQVMLALPVVAMYELSFGLMVIVHLRRDRRLQATPPPTPPPGPQRLPMAIAVPHRPRAGHPSRMDPIRSVGPAVIDMRKHQ